MSKAINPTIFASFMRSCRLPEPIPEFKFHPNRRWRFDFAWPDHYLALEVEGGIWVQGRHNRGSGFLKDMEKYNEATCHGWRIIRTTPQALLTYQTAETVRRAIYRVRTSSYSLEDGLSAFRGVSISP